MFGLLFQLTQLSISIVYPLHQSYKTIQANEAKELNQWLIYWIVLALLLNLQNFFNPIIKFIPFLGLFKTYVLIWLVFPILNKNDYKFDKLSTGEAAGSMDNKINGAIIIWDFYIIPLLINFDTKLTEFINMNTANVKKISTNLFNLVIDTWFNGNKSLKIFGTYDDEEPEKDESFMGSVYVIFKESKFLSAMPQDSNTNKFPSSSTAGDSLQQQNKNLTLLKSLLSIIPYNVSNSDISSTSSKIAASTTTTSSTSTSNDVVSNVEEFDVVDASEIAENVDNDGSVTSTGWFKWRGSSTPTAGALDVHQTTNAHQN